MCIRDRFLPHGLEPMHWSVPFASMSSIQKYIAPWKGLTIGLYCSPRYDSFCSNVVHSRKLLHQAKLHKKIPWHFCSFGCPNWMVTVVLETHSNQLLEVPTCWGFQQTKHEIIRKSYENHGGTLENRRSLSGYFYGKFMERYV